MLVLSCPVASACFNLLLANCMSLTPLFGLSKSVTRTMTPLGIGALGGGLLIIRFTCFFFILPPGSNATCTLGTTQPMGPGAGAGAGTGAVTPPCLAAGRGGAGANTAGGSFAAW